MLPSVSTRSPSGKPDLPSSVDQLLRVRQLRPVDVVRPHHVLGFGIMRDAGVADIELLVVVTESDAVRLERLVGHLRDLAALWVNAINRFLLIRLQRTGVGKLALVDA